MLPLPAVLISVKFTGKGKHPVRGAALKFVVGLAYTIMYCSLVKESAKPAAFLITSFTV